MIPSKSTTSVQGSIPGRSTRMTFDETAITHIVGILTDLYSDPELAVIRELSCNARDSHVQAGRAGVPIVVATPSPLSPYLVIEDTGLGLSVDELHELYSKYGASTKRDSNEVTGMLGIGSKSPLTYTGQFTLTSIHDGTRATVSISRDEDGVGNLTVVDTAATDEPNGVSIKIPAKQGNNFSRKAQKFFAHWEPGTALLDGKDPASAEGMEITPDIRLIEVADRYNALPSVVVMGNVPYPGGDLLSNDALGLPRYGYQVVARVPLGELDPAPSREALQFNTRTKARVRQIQTDFVAGLQAAVQKAINAAPTAFDALKVVRSYSSVLGRNKPQAWLYKGRTLATTLDVPPARISPSGGPGPEGRIIVVNRSDRGKYGKSNFHSIDLTIVTEALFVTDYDRVSFTPTHRNKLEQWIAKQSDSIKGMQRVVFVDWPLPAWMPAGRQVAWATINAEVLPRKGGTSPLSGRIQGSFDLVFGAGNPYTTSSYAVRARAGVPGDQIDQTHPVFWFHGNGRNFSRLQPILDEFHTKYTVVCLPENRIEKFKRENPTVKAATDEVIRLYKTLTDKLTPGQKLRIWMEDDGCRSNFELLAKQPRGAIQDPDVLRFISVLPTDITAFLKARRIFRYEVEWVNDTKVTDPLDKYELFDSYKMRSYGKHMIRYMNAEYAYLKGQK